MGINSAWQMWGVWGVQNTVCAPWQAGSIFFFEYHAESHASLDIPALPEDRSQMNMHGMLKLFQVLLFVLVFVQTCIIAINCIINVNCIICIISDQKSPGYIWADQLCSIWRSSEAVLIPYWERPIARTGFLYDLLEHLWPLSAENGQSVVL